MDAKKQIQKFINPNWIPAVVMIVIFPLIFVGLAVFLIHVLPGLIHAKKSFQKLEALGKLNQAAMELNSPTAKRYMDGKLILTDNFVFCKRTGYVFTYDELVWAYRHRLTQRSFLIPVSVTDSLCLATKTMKAKQVVSMRNDKNDQIKFALLEIHNHNTGCLLGYSDENVAAYKRMYG